MNPQSATTLRKPSVLNVILFGIVGILLVVTFSLVFTLIQRKNKQITTSVEPVSNADNPFTQPTSIPLTPTPTIYQNPFSNPTPIIYVNPFNQNTTPEPTTAYTNPFQNISQ